MSYGKGSSCKSWSLSCRQHIHALDLKTFPECGKSFQSSAFHWRTVHYSHQLGSILTILLTLHSKRYLVKAKFYGLRQTNVALKECDLIIIYWPLLTWLQSATPDTAFSIGDPHVSYACPTIRITATICFDWGEYCGANFALLMPDQPMFRVLE